MSDAEVIQAWRELDDRRQAASHAVWSEERMGRIAPPHLKIAEAVAKAAETAAYTDEVKAALERDRQARDGDAAAERGAQEWGAGVAAHMEDLGWA